MNAIRISIKDIKSNPNNPRIIKDDKFKKLVQSIIDFPKMLEIRPIVVNDEMVVLGGNMRLKACKEAGLKEIPVIKASDLTPEQQREFIIKDNVGFGEWDWAMLANEWDSDELQDWGLDIPDFKTNQLEAVEDDYEIPDEIQTDIVIGDLFEIGEHRLLCGDSTNITDIEKLISGKNFDTIVYDPPFEIENIYSYIPLPIKSQRLILFGNAFHFSDPIVNAVKMGWVSNYELIWDCVTSWYTPNRPLARHKQCTIWGDNKYFNFDKSLIRDDKKRNSKQVENSRGKLDYNPIDGHVHLRTVESFPTTQENGGHKHSKPIKWISAICNGIESKNILDLFSGSGSFMIMAHQNKMICDAMELDPKYCQVIIDRMRKLDPNVKVKRNGIEI
jgi:DNA modification methylase